ncbi:MAG: cytochrome c [Actinomycetota bacterium]|nr:cytochrome c [Actinomycetota bacterium]
MLAFTLLSAPVAAAQEDDGATTDESTATTVTDGATEGGTDPAVLQAGADVYTQVCASCHQSRGAGLEGQFPPLMDNPNVQDAAYVETVIRNGRTGELTVNGVTYNGVMPAQVGLGDEDITAVIAYIQSGFEAPAAEGGAEVATGPVAGTELPGFANLTIITAFVIAAAAIGLVLWPRFVSAHDRRSFPTLDAWLKTAAIVVGFIVFTVIVPSRVLETSAVQELSRPLQDIIASTLWLGGLGAGLWALWYAHRESRI